MIDQCTINIKSGKGGDGIIAFDSRRKADGGNGGKGGDVYVVGDVNVFDFSNISHSKNFFAEDGGIGQKNKRNGKGGEDIYIHVPLVTKILNEDGTEYLTISKNEFKVKVLEGGNGGLGNFSLRGTGWDGKLSRTKGNESESITFKLELNLKADIIFLGYPNAGKSSIVNALSNAKYRVAPYEFTTLEPQLAVMNGKILMDLPGLIEGTHLGKGLGSGFLKHTKYSKLLVHCISLESTDVLKTYLSMRNEIKNISEFLYTIPEFVVFTKADIYSQDELEAIKNDLKKDFKDFEMLSVYLKEDITRLKKRLSSISDTII